jgi:hypothetical protein
MACPNCGGELTRGQGFWICLTCGHKEEGAVRQASAPFFWLLSRLPHALALSVAEYSRAKTTYEKLHRLTDAADLLTRFCTAAILADLLDRSPGHSFPEKVQEALLDRLERPTFGAWAGLLETAVKALQGRLAKHSASFRNFRRSYWTNCCRC